MLTYIEPCGWCSSSRYCPSPVDKLSEPCPNLSSSHSSTSLISSSASISISTNSLSDGKRQLIRSSFAHPNDYHTSKRIDELHERMDDIQISSFLKFINHHLSLKKDPENLHINDLIKDLSNGHILIDLIEILSSTKLKREHGRTRFHSLTNVQYVLEYLKLRMHHIHVSPHEIVSGNRKQILALLWIIMKTFHFPDFRFKNKNCFVENTLLGFGQDRSIILKWLNNLLNHSLNSQQIYVEDFYFRTWNNGYYLSVILKYLIPISSKYFTMKSFDYLKELNSSNQQRLDICLTLSNYCFDTETTIDSTDTTDKCFFKYFTELQQNIFLLLKTNHIGKLIQNNPYTKQILETIIQTTEHSSHIINDNEQYLVCIEEEKCPTENTMDHSTLSSEELSRIRTVEKSRLFNDEQEKMKLKRINRWEKTENIQSDLHLINGHENISKEKQTEKIIDKQQQVNGRVAGIEQKINDQVEADQSTAIIDDLNQLEPIVTDEQITITNVKHQLDESPEASKVEVQQSEQFVESNEENNNDKSEPIVTSQEEVTQSRTTIEEQKSLLASNEKVEQSNAKIGSVEQTTSTITENLQPFVNGTEENDKSTVEQETTEQFVENKNSTVRDKKSEHAATLIEPPQEQNNLSNEEDEQTEASVEKNEQSTAGIEEQKQVLSSNERIESLEQTASTVTGDKPSADINGIVEVPQPITASEENHKFVIERDEIEEPLESQSSTTTTNEKLEQLSSEESLQSLIINEEIKQNAIQIVDTELPVTSNGALEQPTTELEEAKQITGENEILNQSSTPIEKVEQLIENKLPSDVVSNQKTEQSPVIIVQNGSVLTNRKLEKPVVIESQYPITSNGQTNKSTTTNKKPTVNTKKSIPMASPIKSNQYTTSSNEQQPQSTMVIKEPEQPKVVLERPVQAVQPPPSRTKCGKYCEIVDKQIPKANNESVQGAAQLKKQEQTTVSKKKPISSPISNEKSKQSLITAEEISQGPLASTIKDSDESKVSFETRDQSTTVIQEPGVAAISNEETKNSRNKNKKSRRSNAKKGKAKTSSVKTENPPSQSVANIEEEIQPSLPALNPITIIQEEKSNNIKTEIPNSSTVPKSSSLTTNENPPSSSSALRSRKSKKKKTTATTLVERSSASPPLPISSAPHRNLFIIIKESLHDRKIVAFKCVFVLICLCFSIIILVLSHK